MITLLLVSAAGGVGAVARFVLDSTIRARAAWRYPVGTTVINVGGSLLLGLITGLSLSHLVSEQWHVVLGTGFLGGYTTFSAASFETVRLLQERRLLVATANALAVLVMSVLLAAAGLRLGLAA